MSKLYFHYAAMGSGKTLELLRTAYNYEERGHKVLLFTSSLDDRFGVGKVTTRIGLQRDAVPFDRDFNFYVYITELNKGKKPDYILIDEAQFLTRDQVWQLTGIVDKLGITVRCYGLRTDFRGTFFEGSGPLMEVADELREIESICHCGRKATMNLRMQNGKPVFEGDQVFIGGNESYIALCRKHYKEGKIN